MANQKDAGKIAPDVVRSVRWIGRSARRALTKDLSVPRLVLPRITKGKPGSRAGVEHYELHEQLAATKDEPWSIECIDFNSDRIEVTQVTEVQSFLDQQRPDWVKVRWLNVTGLANPEVLRVLSNKYSIHPLALEDVLHIPQRPKAENFEADGRYAAKLFIVVQMMRLMEDKTFDTEQVSLFLGHNTLISLQQKSGDVWQPVRERLQNDVSRLRQNDASFLLYALLDAVVDHYYPVLEQFGDRLERIESTVLEEPDEQIFHRLHSIRRELMLIRRHLWPTREMIGHLIADRPEYLSSSTLTYLRDVQDHATQAIELIDTYREVATGLADAFISAVSHRMNEVMKFLTILATIFIPITFIAGVWGMNFTHMPELDEPWGYAMAWGIFIIISGTMLLWFKRRRWL